MSSRPNQSLAGISSATGSSSSSKRGAKRPPHLQDALGIGPDVAASIDDLAVRRRSAFARIPLDLPPLAAIHHAVSTL